MEKVWNVVLLLLHLCMENWESIKIKIEERGINKSWLARRLGIPQSTLSAYLNGTRTLPDELNNKILTLIQR